MISFVIPCYRSEKTLCQVTGEIQKTMKRYCPAGQSGYEIILVCDGSPDRTYPLIRRLAKHSANIKGIRLSRNFGQHAAVLAGMRFATGEVIVCMDDDLQTPASESVRLIEKLAKGYDVVYARYSKKKHSTFRNAGSVINGIMQTVLFQKPVGLRTSSFFAIRRPVARAVCRYTHSRPYLSGMVLRTTGRIANVPVRHRMRTSGKSSYTVFRLVKLMWNGMVTAFAKPGARSGKPQYMIAETTFPAYGYPSR